MPRRGPDPGSAHCGGRLAGRGVRSPGLRFWTPAGRSARWHVARDGACRLPCPGPSLPWSHLRGISSCLEAHRCLGTVHGRGHDRAQEPKLAGGLPLGLDTRTAHAGTARLMWPGKIRPGQGVTVKTSTGPPPAPPPVPAPALHPCSEGARKHPPGNILKQALKCETASRRLQSEKPEASASRGLSTDVSGAGPCGQPVFSQDLRSACWALWEETGHGNSGRRPLAPAGCCPSLGAAGPGGCGAKLGWADSQAAAVLSCPLSAQPWGPCPPDATLWTPLCPREPLCEGPFGGRLSSQGDPEAAAVSPDRLPCPLRVPWLPLWEGRGRCSGLCRARRPRSGHVDLKDPGARVHTDSVLAHKGRSFFAVCVFSKEPPRVTKGLEPSVHTSALPTEPQGRGWAHPRTQMAVGLRLPDPAEIQMHKSYSFQLVRCGIGMRSHRDNVHLKFNPPGTSSGC